MTKDEKSGFCGAIHTFAALVITAHKRGGSVLRADDLLFDINGGIC
ncbi:MAG: hypothetical protein LIO53_09535 [Oscillospiraceae bacterium]|nr:hypothetical protein [Oscillospiraceae bacterium]